MNEVTHQTLINHARKLRRKSTLGENKLWLRLRGKQLGCRFYRQKPLMKFIVDFYCPQAKLIIEIDGGSHNFGGDYHFSRQALLEREGYTFLRFSENEVRKNVDKIIESIWSFLQSKNLT